MSVLKTEGLVSSELSIELEESGGDAKAVLSYRSWDGCTGASSILI
jgi:hypothetical protein